MTKLIATTVASSLALAAMLNFAGPSNAAPMGDVPTKSEYCKMAKSQRNPISWNARYNCLDQRAAAAPVVEHKRKAKATDPYCNMAKSQKNPVSWNARYNCIDQKAAAAPISAPKRANHAKDPYCDMAKSQRNPVSWNARYNCLASR
jgi:hypothetical protein